MKPFSFKALTEKMFNAIIIAIVVAGTVTLAFVNQVTVEGTLMSKLFLVFLGASSLFSFCPV